MIFLERIMVTYEPVEVKPEDIRRIQQKSLDMYKYFKEICDTHQLTHFFCGGCCIGALRHKGFVPWDDDIDVFMPREDYEKLEKVWHENADESRYKICRTSKTEYTRIQFITISDEHTTFIKTRQADLDIPHGIRLDVIPIDGSPDSAFKRKIQMMWALVYSMFLNGEPHTSKGKAVELVSRFLLFFFPSVKSRYKVWRFAEKQMSKYPLKDANIAKELCVWYEVMLRNYPARLFKGVVYKPFEDIMAPLPVGYDEYLHMAFSGDYMQLPPPEQQIPKHEIVFYDLDNSYKKYKGIYYCKEPVDKKFRGQTDYED